MGFPPISTIAILDRVKDVSPSPRQLYDRIEREDYSENGELSGLLSRASVELDEHVAVHPALRVASWRVVSPPP